MASATRAPGASSCTPGDRTAPATWTTSAVGPVVVVDGERRRPWCWRTAATPPAASAAGRSSHSADRPARPRPTTAADRDAQRRSVPVASASCSSRSRHDCGGRGRSEDLARSDGGSGVSGTVPPRGATRQPRGGRNRQRAYGGDSGARQGSTLGAAGPPSRPRSRAGSAGTPPSAGSRRSRQREVGAEVAPRKPTTPSRRHWRDVHELVAQQPRASRRASAARR